MKLKKVLLLSFLSFNLIGVGYAQIAQEKEQFEKANQLALEQNYSAALPIFENLAEQGNPLAQWNLASLYDQMDNQQKATHWYQVRAEKGDPLAQMILGTRYYHGQGVEKELEKARFWLKKACDQGFQQSCENLNKIKQ